MRDDSSRYKWIEIVNGNKQEVHLGNGQQHDASEYLTKIWDEITSTDNVDLGSFEYNMRKVLFNSVGACL